MSPLRAIDRTYRDAIPFAMSTCDRLPARDNLLNLQASIFQVLDGHASDERPGTSAKSSGLKVIKVARCTRA